MNLFANFGRVNTISISKIAVKSHKLCVKTCFLIYTWDYRQLQVGEGGANFRQKQRYVTFEWSLDISNVNIQSLLNSAPTRLSYNWYAPYASARLAYHSCASYAPYPSLIHALRAYAPLSVSALRPFVLSCYKYRCVCRPPCKKVQYSKK